MAPNFDLLPSRAVPSREHALAADTQHIVLDEPWTTTLFLSLGLTLRVRCAGRRSLPPSQPELPLTTVQHTPSFAHAVSVIAQALLCTARVRRAGYSCLSDAGHEVSRDERETCPGGPSLPVERRHTHSRVPLRAASGLTAPPAGAQLRSAGRPARPARAQCSARPPWAPRTRGVNTRRSSPGNTSLSSALQSLMGTSCSPCSTSTPGRSTCCRWTASGCSYHIGSHTSSSFSARSRTSRSLLLSTRTWR